VKKNICLFLRKVNSQQKMNCKQLIIFCFSIKLRRKALAWLENVLVIVIKWSEKRTIPVIREQVCLKCKIVSQYEKRQECCQNIQGKVWIHSAKPVDFSDVMAMLLVKCSCAQDYHNSAAIFCSHLAVWYPVCFCHSGRVWSLIQLWLGLGFRWTSSPLRQQPCSL
jgi:hypothetical protein